MSQLNGKMSPFLITIDDDVELLLDSQNEKTCKNPLNITLLPKGVSVNDDIGEDSDDEGDDGEDFYSQYAGGEMHDTLFDVNFVETNQNKVGTS